MTFSGLVLAGGRSSRMGVDKASLRINDVSLLDYTQVRLTLAGASEVLISQNTFIKGTVPDIYPHQGPLSGIHAALMESQLPGLLCMPVDMPLVSARTIKKLAITGIEHNRPVFYKNYFLPCYIPANAAIKEHLEQLLTSDESKSVRNFLRHFNALELDVTDEYELINANTPEQWAQVQTQINTFLGE